jgi:leader peptidase (prepilin peptidase)/N-methyltransferase
MDPAVLLPFLAVLGLLIGSFLNVVVHRVPRGLNINRPPSACPSCGHAVRVRDNVPVFSWLMLRGRCRDCSAPISARYPAVEAGTAVLFVALGAKYHDAAVLPALLILGAAGVSLALIDLEHRRLPFVITVPLLVVTVVAVVAAGHWDGWNTLDVAVFSTLVWFGLFATLYYGTGGRGMGFGDVVLSPTLGFSLGWLGWGASLVGLLGGFATGAVVGVALMVAGRAGRRSAVPFGPFMLIGALIGIFFGQDVWRHYLDASGLN